MSGNGLVNVNVSAYAELNGNNPIIPKRYEQDFENMYEACYAREFERQFAENYPKYFDQQLEQQLQAHSFTKAQIDQMKDVKRIEMMPELKEKFREGYRASVYQLYQTLKASNLRR